MGKKLFGAISGILTYVMFSPTRFGTKQPQMCFVNQYEVTYTAKQMKRKQLEEFINVFF